ncbi:MAG: HAD family hydrolase [Syntrophobacterales bacterium]|nr:HAD family hydrolase [Syntrophobacterales bacterium]
MSEETGTETIPVIKGVIFDFDGTLTELTLDFRFMKAEIVKIVRRYVQEETVTALKDHPILEMIYEAEDRLGKTGAKLRQEAFERLRILELEASMGKEVYPYTREVLALIKKKSVKVGVITRSCIDVLRGVFPDIDEYVMGIVTREHLREVKPHPGQAYAISSLLSIYPEESMLAGDHPTDIAAGKAAGMKTVGLLTGRTTKHEFEKAGATYILEDIRGIPDLIH